MRQAEKLEEKLKNKKYSKYYSESKEKLFSFSDFIRKLEEEKKQTLFNIAESTGTGNYKSVELWSWVEIVEYLKMKKKQIEKINNIKKNE